MYIKQKTERDSLRWYTIHAILAAEFVESSRVELELS